MERGSVNGLGQTAGNCRARIILRGRSESGLLKSNAAAGYSEIIERAQNASEFSKHRIASIALALRVRSDESQTFASNVARGGTS